MRLPPVAQRINRKLMRIAGGANLNIANVLSQVIQSVWNGFASRQRGPIMVIDRYRRLRVGMSRFIQRAD